MESTQSLLQALDSLNPGRLGEINLLLAALSGGSRQQELIPRVISQMAGRCDRIPQPHLYIAVALQLGIVCQEGGYLQLTGLGRLLLDAITWPPYDRLSDGQIEILTAELVCHPELTDSMVSVLRLMGTKPDCSKCYGIGSIKLTRAQILALQLLQVLRFASAESDYVVVSPVQLDRLRSLLGDRAAQSEEELWELLEQSHFRARTAEEFVVEFERQRLVVERRQDLAELVERVSRYDVGAGFDVRSFDSDGSVRYIEVKSSTNLRGSFYWSLGERRFAEEHRQRYWIYFVPRAQDLPQHPHGLILINDPTSWCGRYLVEEPTSFRVSLTDDAVLTQISAGATEARQLA